MTTTTTTTTAENRTIKRHFVIRSIDNAILTIGGTWEQKPWIDQIKFYKNLSNAQRFGLGRIPPSLYKKELGNLYSIGTVKTVYPGESVDCFGNVEKVK
jgi:hypothetical protein